MRGLLARLPKPPHWERENSKPPHSSLEQRDHGGRVKVNAGCSHTWAQRKGKRGQAAARADLLLAQRTHWTTKRRPAARGRIGSQACSAQAMHALGVQAHDSCEGKPRYGGARADAAGKGIGRGREESGLHLRGSDSAAAPGFRALGPSTPLKRRRACLFIKNRDFSSLESENAVCVIGCYSLR